jgi:hypothetical protein
MRTQVNAGDAPDIAMMGARARIVIAFVVPSMIFMFGINFASVCCSPCVFIMYRIKMYRSKCTDHNVQIYNVQNQNVQIQNVQIHNVHVHYVQIQESSARTLERIDPYSLCTD